MNNCRGQTGNRPTSKDKQENRHIRVSRVKEVWQQLQEYRAEVKSKTKHALLYKKSTYTQQNETLKTVAQ